MADQEEIVRVIQTFFETGKTKDFSVLGNIQLNSPEFSSFSDVQVWLSFVSAINIGFVNL